MKYLIFDTETTGLLPSYTFIKTDYIRFPRVIQLTFSLIDTDNSGNIYLSNNLIKPDGWVVPNKRFWIQNGFSNEKNIRSGIPIEFALSDFIKTLKKADYIVGHNVDFDYKIMLSELYRIGYGTELLESFEDKKICTMKQSKEYCRIPKDNMCGYKYPKLSELYFELFGKKMENAHDSLYDVFATRDCFLELKRLNVIND